VIHLRLKYSSILTTIATIKIKFRIFPTPKYDSKRKSKRATLKVIPRRELANNKEKVKRSVKKTIIKNIGVAPKVPGSIK